MAPTSIVERLAQLPRRQPTPGGLAGDLLHEHYGNLAGHLLPEQVPSPPRRNTLDLIVAALGGNHRHPIPMPHHGPGPGFHKQPIPGGLAGDLIHEKYGSLSGHLLPEQVPAPPPPAGAMETIAQAPFHSFEPAIQQMIGAHGEQYSDPIRRRPTLSQALQAV